MSTTKRTQTGINGLLNSERVRRVERDGRTFYAAVDVVAVLTDSRHPAQYWEDLKQREPALAGLSQLTHLPAAGADNGTAQSVEVLDFEGLMRLVQSIPTAKAERVKLWLARNARERMEEAENPELAVLRTRRLYEQKGYSRQWVDKRLRGVSARHELTGEWYKRGARESDQFRALTNEIMHGAFGMDVEGYRRFKNLFKTGENLRDHMTDVELALTALGETVAVALHRDRRTDSYDNLLADVKDAGEIVAKTRTEIESRTGHPVVQPVNHRAWWMGGGRRTGSTTTRPRGAAGGPVPGTESAATKPVDVEGQMELPGMEAGDVGTAPEAPAQTHGSESGPVEKAVA